MSSYLTVARGAQVEIEVKRSRFLCTVARVDDEVAARALVERLRRQHGDAGHHCSAFRIHQDSVERSSDDGEPAGTAGAPMLEVLRGAGLGDVIAVVTRWFGGTLLGAGGLVRAYGDAVRATLDSAGTLQRTLAREHLLELDHLDAGRIESELRSRGFAVLDTAYAVGVSLTLGVPPADEPRLAAVLAELTAGTATTTVAGERWVDSLSP
ncbi:YigZ family protein [Nocardioides sp. URHA0020]|uniref:YigZ family protein n=1 Tax=Nocardioides sp. URHA0020 TaxID=1380392 RepID=UPI000687B82E|nr:YigZ family protein [Nocardioides sp. URHA0020]